MQQQSDNPRVVLLQIIGESAPDPWYFRLHARATGSDPEALVELLDFLRLEGLVEIVKGTPETGPGAILSATGQEVLRDPEALARLQSGAAVRPNDPGAVIRQSLFQPTSAPVTRILMFLNFAVFAWCIWLGYKQNVLGGYLMMQAGGDVVEKVLHPAGGVSAIDILRGEWWRLMTSCFVHAGLLHIAMNMYAVWAVGRFTEQTWGSGRYLLMYLLSGWGGSCLALALAPTTTIQGQHIIITGVGASGALCGIVAATGVWVILNGKHLPRPIAQRLRSQMFTNGLLIVFMSLLPGVSGLGHLGGAILGAVSAVILQLQRFGPGFMRVVGLVLLVPLPWLSYEQMQMQRPTSPGWHVAEEVEYARDVLRPYNRTMNDSIRAYRDKIDPTLNKHPERRDKQGIQEARKALYEQIAALETLQANLEKRGPYYDERVKEVHQAGMDYLKKRIEVYQLSDKCLEEGPAWTRADERGLQQEWTQLRTVRKKWEGLLERE